MSLTNFIKLSELSSRIDNALKSAFQSIPFWVVADVTNHTHKPSSNYHYFELVEKDDPSSNILAKFSAKAWGAGSRQLEDFEKITGQRFTNNIHVLVSVLVEFHPTYGLQLQLTGIDTGFTVGLLEQQRQATLKKLVDENPGHISKVGEEYLTRNKSLKLNHVIQNIAVISSQLSAGLQDFVHTLNSNPFNYRFRIDEYYTEVQGESNAVSLRDTLVNVFKSGVKYDVVVITRGGGAQTDFTIFDNYFVGQAIARFPIPVITGIGHQKNTAIADLMAHTQTKTPTKSAEFIIAHNRSFEESILKFQKSVLIRSQQILSVNFQSLSSLNSGVVNNSRNILNLRKDALNICKQVTVNGTKTIMYTNRTALVNISSQISSRPRMIVSNSLNDVQNLVSNLKTFNALYLKNQLGYLRHYVSVIKLVSPENTLRRGFALIKHNDKIVAGADGIAAGDSIAVILSGKELGATVHSKKNYHGNEFNI